MSAHSLFLAIPNGPQSSIKKAIPLTDCSNAHIAALDNAKMLSLNKISARITAAVRGCPILHLLSSKAHGGQLAEQTQRRIPDWSKN
jgi:hypothetical protein